MTAVAWTRRDLRRLLAPADDRRRDHQKPSVGRPWNFDLLSRGGRYRQSDLPIEAALLRKSSEVRRSPFPGRTHSTASVTGMPSVVKPLRTATLMELCDLKVEVPCGQALVQELDTVHLGLGPASAVMRAQNFGLGYFVLAIAF